MPAKISTGESPSKNPALSPGPLPCITHLSAGKRSSPTAILTPPSSVLVPPPSHVGPAFWATKLLPRFLCVFPCYSPPQSCRNPHTTCCVARDGCCGITDSNPRDSRRQCREPSAGRGRFESGMFAIARSTFMPVLPHCWLATINSLASRCLLHSTDYTLLLGRRVARLPRCSLEYS